MFKYLANISNFMYEHLQLNLHKIRKNYFQFWKLVLKIVINTIKKQYFY